MKMKEKGWKKAVVLMLALIVCISSIVVPQPEEVSAKAANRIDFKINGKTGSKVTLYAGEYVKFTIDCMWQDGQYIQTQGSNAYGDKINFNPSKELTYKSSNNAVATVTNKGVITAKKKGTCKITVTSIYNSKVKGSIKVTVSKKKQNTKITLEKKKTTIKIKSYKGISRKGVKFASSNKKVATVSSKGKVTAKKAGTATITVTSVVNKKAVAKFTVTVKNPDTINTSYTPTGKKKIILDETSATLAPESSFDKMPRAVDGMPDAVFNAGDIEDWAKMPINITGDNDPGRKYYIVCAKMLVSNKKKYGTAQIKIKSMTGLKNREVTYKSSNKGVASVSSTGKVTPKKAGTAVITVTSKSDKSVSATYTVTVRKLVTAFQFEMYTNLKKQDPDPRAEYEDDVYDYREVMSTRDVLPLNAENKNFTLTSSDESIIKVYDNFAVAGVGYGTATLTLKSADGFCKYSWKCTVTDKGTTCWHTQSAGD
jgi:uncharacterized protein YjdB